MKGHKSIAHKRDEHRGAAAGFKVRWSPERPCLILIMGVAGSGKTTLAKHLLHRLRAVYLDNNHIADAFFPQTRSGKSYEKLRPCFYQVLYAITEANLKAGNSVLVDAPHVKQMQERSWRTFVKQLVKRTRSCLVILRCVCPEDIVRARLEDRGEKRDRAKLSRWRSFLEREPIRAHVPFAHLDVDTTQSLSHNTVVALQYILSRSRGRAERKMKTVTGCISRPNEASTCSHSVRLT